MSGMTRELHPLGLPRGIALPVDSRLRHVSTGRAVREEEGVTAMGMAAAVDGAAGSHG
ncbi:hypothetical protein [[Clostridium] symbiosum]